MPLIWPGRRRDRPGNSVRAAHNNRNSIEQIVSVELQWAGFVQSVLKNCAAWTPDRHILDSRGGPAGREAHRFGGIWKVQPPPTSTERPLDVMCREVTPGKACGSSKKLRNAPHLAWQKERRPRNSVRAAHDNHNSIEQIVSVELQWAGFV